MRLLVAMGVLGFCALSIGCGPAATPPTAGPSTEEKAYILSAEPAGVKGVKQLKVDSKDGEEVVAEGRIGGDTNPWIEGQAAFLFVDKSLSPCDAKEGCPTPWDYCCDTDQLPACKALVKFVDASGKPVATDARKLLGVKEMQTIVVRGTAKRDEAGNLTVLANGIFVRN
ncbi:hypothetical protein [Anatilimnocola floriformis]|uniref:hypothetical protein n=1 Tax=Anatilimnocola floriformis TaxID=2948575 RepID=UPI0020C29779|nr:hypothetical protein [Anatilimnocola floriformis]